MELQKPQQFPLSSLENDATRIRKEIQLPNEMRLHYVISKIDNIQIQLDIEFYGGDNNLESKSITTFYTSDINRVFVEREILDYDEELLSLKIYFEPLADCEFQTINGSLNKGLRDYEEINFKSEDELNIFLDDFIQLTGIGYRERDPKEYIYVNLDDREIISFIVTFFEEFGGFNNCYSLARGLLQTSLPNHTRPFLAPQRIDRHPFSRTQITPYKFNLALAEDGFTRVDEHLLGTEQEPVGLVSVYLDYSDDFHFIRKFAHDKWLQAFSGNGLYLARHSIDTNNRKKFITPGYSYLGSYILPDNRFKVEMSGNFTSGDLESMITRSKNRRGPTLAYFP